MIPDTDCNDFWEYDPTTNTWTQKANFGGTPRDGAVGFSIGSKGYIGTGEINHLDLFIMIFGNMTLLQIPGPKKLISEEQHEVRLLVLVLGLKVSLEPEQL